MSTFTSPHWQTLAIFEAIPEPVDLTTIEALSPLHSVEVRDLIEQSVSLGLLKEHLTDRFALAEGMASHLRKRLVRINTKKHVASLVAHMKLADVGLAIYQNTCRNNYYCAPNKVYEYASVGLPIVGPNFPEVQHLVDTYKIGKTFDPSSSDQIASAIRDVLASPEAHSAMSTAALALKESVNWEAQEDRLHAVYEALLAPASAERVSG